MYSTSDTFVFVFSLKLRQVNSQTAVQDKISAFMYCLGFTHDTHVRQAAHLRRVEVHVAYVNTSTQRDK
jgi:hypothetical protein